MNASNSRTLALPKPRKQAKVVKRLQVRRRIVAQSQQQRKEQALVAKVFADLEERDGQCVIAKIGASHRPFGEYWLVGECSGASTPMHIGEWRRGRTRGQPPEARHSSMTIARGCLRHHGMYDRHEFDLKYDRELGADFPMSIGPYVKGAVA